MFGAIIGATWAFSNTNSPLTWFHNAKRYKWTKIFVVNIWLIAMGAVSYYMDVKGLVFFERFGLNSYFIKIVISFLVTVVATGAIPEYIFNSFEEKHNHSMALGSTFYEWSPQVIKPKAR
jgi:hypothetical protein